MLLTVILIALIHLCATLPSVVYHTVISIYYKYTRRESEPQTLLTNKKVLLFIHGRGGHYNDFITTIKNLKERVPKEYYMRTVDLGDTLNTSIDTEASILSQSLQLYQDCEITLIGLSKGGLVAMRYITTRNDDRIKNVITICSPLRGTRITELLSSDSITNKELGLNSEITQEMANVYVDIPIYHIVPNWDHLIIPTSSAAYEHTDESNIYRYNGNYSHSGIQYCPEIADAIARFIKPIEL
jgi:pimeloyl-ACP methyl ester carboxylesterase